MKREIKFRAMEKDWDDRTGEWGYFGIWGHCDINDYDPETLGEFTNLHDKNGKEIYEGDIIKNEDGIFRVIYEECFFCGKLIKWFKWYFYEWPTEYFDTRYKKCEVIGNIYENKSLLEETK